MDYENRFRDPAFLAVWDRWQKARTAWREAAKHVACHLFQPPHESWNPDLALMPERAHGAAREFLEARVAYKAKLMEYEG